MDACLLPWTLLSLHPGECLIIDATCHLCGFQCLYILWSSLIVYMLKYLAHVPALLSKNRQSMSRHNTTLAASLCKELRPTKCSPIPDI